MSKPDVLQIIPIPEQPQHEAERAFTLHKLYEAEDQDGLIESVANRARGVLTNGHLGADATLMDRLPQLEIVGCYGVGVDAVDLEAAKARSVRVTNTPEVLTDAVAELALGLLLDVARRISFNDRYVRAGTWRERGDPPLSRSLAGRKVGILGIGRIGRATANRLEPFGVELAYHGPNRKPDVRYRYFDRLVDMAQAVDVLMVTCVGSRATEGIVTREVIEALGPDGWLINMSRGFVIDEPALVDSLVEGRLGAAGLDVFLEEPEVPAPLLEMDNVVLQPHQASGTVETRSAMGMLTVDNLKAHFAGQPLLTPVV
jgi:lactate dehydrogenase-like 2-hydroxyacid dehydrogenase